MYIGGSSKVVILFILLSSLSFASDKILLVPLHLTDINAGDGKSFSEISNSIFYSINEIELRN